MVVLANANFDFLPRDINGNVTDRNIVEFSNAISVCVVLAMAMRNTREIAENPFARNWVLVVVQDMYSEGSHKNLLSTDDTHTGG
jgi:hypothetical protein